MTAYKRAHNELTRYFKIQQLYNFTNFVLTKIYNFSGITPFSQTADTWVSSSKTQNKLDIIIFELISILTVLLIGLQIEGLGT